MAQKSGYLNRTLEFHKIYEEEIIPILKSYKQQKEKADEKNRYDYLGAALCFLSLITFMLACSGSVERFYSMILCKMQYANDGMRIKFNHWRLDFRKKSEA